ncbi:uncharacterized protein LOC133800070 [Humulus lupulus]|uniref:uncharacterized protein LOC133800070 n=1 Tax=Humulus lupulus TaxID=3486 RepID=UPI002B413E94|nr:uncharacterized protein LOC133800070 [Humulus lupulus]
MSQAGDDSLRAMFQGGNPPSGPLVKRLWPTKQAVGTSSLSPAKGKNPGPSSNEKVPPPPPAAKEMPPPPPQPPVLAREKEAATGTLPTTPPEGLITVSHAQHRAVNYKELVKVLNDQLVEAQAKISILTKSKKDLEEKTEQGKKAVANHDRPVKELADENNKKI